MAIAKTNVIGTKREAVHTVPSGKRATSNVIIHANEDTDIVLSVLDALNEYDGAEVLAFQDYMEEYFGKTFESPNPESGGRFGYSVAITDNYLAVGAYTENGGGVTSSGRVHIIERATGSVQTLESPNPETIGYFGAAVAITDNHLAVGANQESGGGVTASGRVYVYTNTGGTYGSVQTLESPNPEGDGIFGFSVSITDNYLAVGAYQEDAGATNAGRAYVYTNTGGTYGSAQTIQSPNPESSGYFGSSVSITDNYLAVGAREEDAGGLTSSGRAYVYTNTGGTYGSVQTLESPNPESSGLFGSSVSITDNYLAVGAYQEDAGATNAGRAYVYTNTGGTYGSAQTIQSPNPESSGYFGSSVSITDNYLAVGAREEDAGGITASGRAYVYTNTGGTYGSVQTLESPNRENSGLFGYSVAIAPNTTVLQPPSVTPEYVTFKATPDVTTGSVFVGAYQEDPGTSNAGRAYLIPVYADQTEKDIYTQAATINIELVESELDQQFLESSAGNTDTFSLDAKSTFERTGLVLDAGEILHVSQRNGGNAVVQVRGFEGDV